MARPWRSPTVRERILATVLVLAFAALTISGGTAWFLQRSRVDRQMNDSLDRTIAEARSLAEEGVDPSTGDGFASTERLLYTMLQRQVPAPNEGMIALIGDTVRYEHPGARLSLNDDPEFVALLAGASERDYVPLPFETARTTEREYRYAALPVRVSGGAPGVLVLAFDREAELAEVDATFRTYAIIAGVSLLVLGATAWVLSSRLLSPLRALRETAEQISDSDLSRRIPVSGRDDLADLTRIVNDMFARLETSFRSQRQLLDDAGHELRTPITIVRGHLELMDPSDPQDAAETRELTLRELDRMHRLADDLVLLAKAEAPSFLRPEPTDVGLLLDNVLDHARQLGDRRWRLDARPDVTATLDGQRLTQALLQLTANAVRFSDDGSRISIGGSAEPGELRLWVRDEGIGIAAEDTERIFDRFARADESRRRDGTGLGLPIVAAITTAHHGRVSVDSRVGGGSTFTLHIPTSFVVDDLDDEEIVVEEIVVEESDLGDGTSGSSRPTVEPSAAQRPDSATDRPRAGTPGGP